jgi:hypothetical protein
MFTIDQTLSYPSFFQKRLDNFSYFFKRVLPLLLVYFVSFSNSTTHKQQVHILMHVAVEPIRNVSLKGLVRSVLVLIILIVSLKRSIKIIHTYGL